MSLPDSVATGVLAFSSACSMSSGGSSFRNCDGWQGINWPYFFPAAAMAEGQCLHRPGDGHIKQPALFVQGALRLWSANAEEQACLRGLPQTRAETPVLCNCCLVDEGDGVAGFFFFLLAFAVEGDSFRGTCSGARMRAVVGEPLLPMVAINSFKVANAIVSGIRDFFSPAA